MTLTVENLEPLVDQEPSEELITPTLYEGSLLNEADRKVAVTSILQGELVASTLRTFGLWFDGGNKTAFERSFTVKGEEALHKTRSIMGFIHDYAPYIDLEMVHPDLRDLVADPDAFQETVGATFFVRLPLKAAIADQIPSGLRSFDATTGRTFIHLLDPTGHEGMSLLIKDLNQSGVKFVGVTSLNEKGQPEIRDTEEAKNFCAQHISEVPVLLTDTRLVNTEFTGSYAIVDLVTKNVVRRGQISVPLIEKMLGTKLNAENAKAAKFENPQEMEAKIGQYELSSKGTRLFILAYSEGSVTFKDSAHWPSSQEITT